MKILQVTTELRLAGAERVIANLSCELRRRGHAVGVVSLMPLPADEAGTIMPRLRGAGIDIFSLDVTKFTPWKLRGLNKIVADFQPDIIHSHLLHANIAARLFKGRTPAPLINSVHIAESRPSAWWHFVLDRWTRKRCACQTAVSTAVRDFHAAKTKSNPEDIPVIPNGIAPPRRCDADRTQALRHEWGVEDGAKIIGSVGRLNPQKGYDRLLRALPDLGKIIPDGEAWGFVILGEGGQRPELESLAKDVPPHIRVVMPGFRPDAADCVGAFDLFVMPSRYEGFGLTLAEAMAHGVPVLASDLPVLREVAAGYDAIRFTPFSSPAETAEAINRGLALDPTDGRLSYSVFAMTEHYLALYQSMIDGNPHTDPTTP